MQYRISYQRKSRITIELFINRYILCVTVEVSVLVNFVKSWTEEDEVVVEEDVAVKGVEAEDVGVKGAEAEDVVEADIKVSDHLIQSQQ